MEVGDSVKLMRKKGTSEKEQVKQLDKKLGQTYYHNLDASADSHAARRLTTTMLREVIYVFVHYIYCMFEPRCLSSLLSFSPKALY